MLGAEQVFLLLSRQCTYFCLASQMALLGFISYHLMPQLGFKLILVELAPLLWDLNSGTLYRLSYHDCGLGTYLFFKVFKVSHDLRR